MAAKAGARPGGPRADGVEVFDGLHDFTSAPRRAGRRRRIEFVLEHRAV